MLASSRVLLWVAFIAACSGSGDTTGLTSATTGASGGGGTSGEATSDTAPTGYKLDLGAPESEGEGGGARPCENLECQIPSCPMGQETVIRGTVFAPEGTLPLYNVVAYVPNAPPGAVPGGLYCATCKANLPGDPIVAAITDTRGEFTLKKTPAGADIPLVITIGKWRRQVTLPHVEPCADNVVDPALTRLPRRQIEGDLPKIAAVTGGRDRLECLLRRIGIDDGEFSSEGGPGRVHIYAGRGGANRISDELGGEDFSPAQSLWDNPGRLADYDMLVLSCEGSTDEKNKSHQARQNLVDYADAGGRIFLSHWHNVWIAKGAGGWPSAATFDHSPDLPSPFVVGFAMTFPKGVALAEWMTHVDGLDPYGEVTIFEGQNTIASVNPEASTRWIHAVDPEGVQCFSFNTPLGAPRDAICGRVVDTDIHVTSGGGSKTFPKNCPGIDEPLTAQEKVLMFMLFDLSACLLPDDEIPHIPGPLPG